MNSVGGGVQRNSTVKDYITRVFTKNLGCCLLNHYCLRCPFRGMSSYRLVIGIIPKMRCQCLHEKAILFLFFTPVSQSSNLNMRGCTAELSPGRITKRKSPYNSVSALSDYSLDTRETEHCLGIGINSFSNVRTPSA